MELNPGPSAWFLSTLFDPDVNNPVLNIIPTLNLYRVKEQLQGHFFGTDSLTREEENGSSGKPIPQN